MKLFELDVVTVGGILEKHSVNVEAISRIVDMKQVAITQQKDAKKKAVIMSVIYLIGGGTIGSPLSRTELTALLMK